MSDDLTSEITSYLPETLQFQDSGTVDWANASQAPAPQIAPEAISNISIDSGLFSEIGHGYKTFPIVYTCPTDPGSQNIAIGIQLIKHTQGVGVGERPQYQIGLELQDTPSASVKWSSSYTGETENRTLTTSLGGEAGTITMACSPDSHHTHIDVSVTLTWEKS